jgi:type IV pilus assembly protein PilC
MRQRNEKVRRERDFMPSFSYTAKSEDGRRVQGKIHAEDFASAERELQGSHRVVYRVEEESSESRNVRILSALAPVQLEELVGFSQAIASMADGGISIKRTIDILLEDTENATMLRILTDISGDLAGGKSTLAQALSRHSAVFPSYYVAMTEAGESSGNLPEMMRRLADILTAVESLEARAKSALSYPLLLFAFTSLSFLFFFAYGSVYLEGIYSSLEVEAPILTRLLLGLGVTLGQNKAGLFVLLSFSVYLVWSFTRKGSGRILFDKIRLSLPILGNVYRVLYTARFMRTMSILYRSGLGLARSVRLAAATIGNDVVTEDLFDLSLELDKGDELSKTLRSSHYVSRLAVGMIAAGEECGKLETMLTKVADVYDVKSENLLQNVRSRIEPAVMLCLGLSIALLFFVLGWPLISLLSAA